MLTSLSINNYLTIEHIELEFTHGMTAITGETGAGKSILLDALKLSMGGRVSQEAIDKKNERVEIRSSFDITKRPDIIEWLKKRDLDHESGCILRRIITPDGRSRSYINGTLSILSDLRDIGDLLVQIHGQHAYQSLLKSESQRTLLDNYAGCHEQLQKTEKLWHACVQCKTAIKNFYETDSSQSARIQLLQYQLEELEKIALQQNTLKLLENEHSQLAGAEENRRTCQDLLGILSDNNGQDIIQQINSCLRKTTDEQLFDEAQPMLECAKIQIEETIAALHQIEDSIEVEPDRLTNIESLLSCISDLARKHHIQPYELYDHQSTLQKELDDLTGNQQNISDLEYQLEQLTQSLTEAATKLSIRRKSAAENISTTITGLLKQLDMKTTKFHVEVSDLSSIESHGMDKITFQIQNSNDDSPANINKIASGGELSRIGLAIQIVTAKNTYIKSLVFDEIDVGIGGATAEIVGRLLRQLGDNHQVLCVTHQAQVASLAHHHLSVVKQKKDCGNIRNQVKSLNEHSREKEVARMIAGVEITGKALAHAKEMINRTRA